MDIRVILHLGDSAVTRGPARAWNMSVDESMLEAASRSQTATLRLYQWSQPTLSLGYFQRSSDRKQHDESRECSWVRRSTGGGAIVHHHDLTYCFTWPTRPRGDLSHVYDLFHTSLVAAFRDHGVDAALCESTIAQQPEPFLCFQRRSKGDILLKGHKIGGSAQRRRRNAAMQHGSILWRRSEFAPELKGVVDLAKPTRDIEDFGLRWMDQLRNQWAQFTAPNLDFNNDDNFTSGDLNADELARAAQLSKERFAHPLWNEKR